MVARDPSAAGVTTNRWATISLVLACLWLFGAGSIAALFTARRAKREVRADPGRQRGEGLALAAQMIAVYGLVIAFLFAANRSIRPADARGDLPSDSLRGDVAPAGRVKLTIVPFEADGVSYRHVTATFRRLPLRCDDGTKRRVTPPTLEDVLKEGERRFGGKQTTSTGAGDPPVQSFSFRGVFKSPMRATGTAFYRTRAQEAEGRSCRSGRLEWKAAERS